MQKRKGPALAVATMLFVLVSISGARAAPDCAGLDGCARKACEVRYEIGQAQKYNDVFKEMGLRDKLSHVLDHCHDGRMSDDVAEDIRDVADEVVDVVSDAREDTSDFVDEMDELRGDVAAGKDVSAKLEDHVRDLRRKSEEYAEKIVDARGKLSKAATKLRLVVADGRPDARAALKEVRAAVAEAGVRFDAFQKRVQSSVERLRALGYTADTESMFRLVERPLKQLQEDVRAMETEVEGEV